MKSKLAGLYEAAVFTHPNRLLLVLLLICAASSWFALQFRMDASADALVLENDAALRYYREVAARYESEDFLFVSYQPIGRDLFADATLQDIGELRDELEQAIPRLSKVLTLLDVPLIDSPRIGLSDLADGAPKLLSPEVDRELARRELSTSPAYGNNLVSSDAGTTALLLTFKRDPRFYELLDARESLRQIKLERALTAEERQQLETVSRQFSDYQAAYNEQRTADIATIRGILDQHREQAQLFLGGASMVASDMVAFIRSDLVIFGGGVLAFLIATLVLIFRKPRWVILPMICCGLTALISTGLLGLLDWPVTVISSNFISLLLIITLSMTIHLIVRYRELQAKGPEKPHRDLVRETIRQMAMPCFYMTTTTVVAFGSLVSSGIRPVIDFGYMMMCGVGLAFVLVFLLFPLGLQLLRPLAPVSLHDHTEDLTMGIARFTLRRGGVVIGLALLLAAFTAVGVTRLEVENRFIDYFKSDTEIHQGMLVIDQKLGGTTPLEVIIDADEALLAAMTEPEEGLSEEEAIFGDDFAEEPVEDEDAWLEDAYADEETGESDGPDYWFNNYMLERLEAVHDYLDGLPEVGKVSSLATLAKMTRMLNNDQAFGDFELAVMQKNMPEDLRQALVEPYWSAEANQVRIVMRVMDSNKELRRGELIEKIERDIVDRFDFKPEHVHMTGMLVLYNNMLQSLFSSQIMTLGFVMLAIMLMFLVLFRSFYISLVAMIPNALAAVSVLGLIGWLGIPLDLMTITIAAITVGIAVDNAIHYIYRFRVELQVDGDYAAAVKRSHASIGKAMYYTSMTIIMGFSILVISNFIPTIYFGALASLAMFIALLCNLVLLPRLLVLLKPMGEVAVEGAST